MNLHFSKKNIVFFLISSYLSAVSSYDALSMRINKPESSSEECVALSKMLPQMKAVGYISMPEGYGSGTLVDKFLSTASNYVDRDHLPSDIFLTCAHNFDRLLERRKEEFFPHDEKESPVSRFISLNVEGEGFFVGFEDIYNPAEVHKHGVKVSQVFLPREYVNHYFQAEPKKYFKQNFEFAFAKLEKEVAEIPPVFIAFQPFGSISNLKGFIGLGYGNEKCEKRAGLFKEVETSSCSSKYALVLSKDIHTESGDSGGPALTATSIMNNELLVAGLILGLKLKTDDIQDEDEIYNTENKTGILPLPTIQGSLFSTLHTKPTFIEMFEAAGGEYMSIMDSVVKNLKKIKEK